MNVSRKNWIKFSFFNTFEQALARVADAGVAILLIWSMPTPAYSKLALAQAVVAPFLFLFISPAIFLYREFARWRGEGASSMAYHLRILRKFGWGIAQLALVLTFILAAVLPGSETYRVRFFSLAWAFSIPVGIYVFSSDREFLRLDLKFKPLNVSTVYQKMSFLTGTALAVFFGHARVEYLAAASVFSLVTTAILVRKLSTRILLDQGASLSALRGVGGPKPSSVILSMLKNFSIWNHLSGSILVWIQSMDLFFLGVFRFPAFEVGLYSTALKIGNVALALPMAVGSLFAVRLGQRFGHENIQNERKEIGKFSLLLMLAASLQTLIVLALSPWFIRLLSHGRWSEDAQGQVFVWMRWILLGGVIFSSGYMWNWWFTMRGNVRQLLFRLYLPWLVFSLAIYATAAHASILNVAQANIWVALVFLGLVGIQLLKVQKS